MAENFTAPSSSSSSPRPPRRAACTLQRVHGASASRVPVADAAAAAAALRNLSRTSPLLPGFRRPPRMRPEPRPAGPSSAASGARRRFPGSQCAEAPALGSAPGGGDGGGDGGWRDREAGVGRGEPSGIADSAQACGERARRRRVPRGGLHGHLSPWPALPSGGSPARTEPWG